MHDNLKGNQRLTCALAIQPPFNKVVFRGEWFIVEE